MPSNGKQCARLVQLQCSLTSIHFRLDSNSDADVDDLKSRKKQLEEAVQPIIAKLYASGAGGEQAQPDAGTEKEEL